jgi:hypothetical protein
MAGPGLVDAQTVTPREDGLRQSLLGQAPLVGRSPDQIIHCGRAGATNQRLCHGEAQWMDLPNGSVVACRKLAHHRASEVSDKRQRPARLTQERLTSRNGE